jgi:hypothetical protein
MGLDAGSIFLDAPNYSSGTTGAVAIAAVDVNGDRKLDLLVAGVGTGGYAGSVGVLLGNGDGTFLAAVNYGSGGLLADSIAVADVNGDGKPDLLVANECGALDDNGFCSGSGIVGVLLGNGDGTFQPAVSYDSGGGGAYSVAVADVNGDGKPDLIVASIESVAVLLGNGDGTFQPAVSYSYSPPGYGGYSVAVADVNGDGKLDLIVAIEGAVAVLLGNGDGTFQPDVSYNSGGWGYSFSVAVADLNGDGKPDIVVTNQFECDPTGSPDCSHGTVGVLLGNGDGTFQTAQTYSSEGYEADSVVVVDANGDGKKDLAIASVSTAGGAGDTCGTVGVLLGNGDGTFRPFQTYAIDGAAAAIAVGDVSGDGKPDLLVAGYDVLSGNGGNVAVLLGRGNGTFQAAPNYAWALSPNGGLSGIGPFAVADVNGDGNPDVVGIIDGDNTCANAQVGVLLGNGHGAFRQGPTSCLGSSNPGPVSIAVADVNGDGKPDLLVVNGCASGSAGCIDGSVGVLLGNGNGTFRPGQTYSSQGTYAGPIAVGDVNGDGKLDVLLGNYYDGSGNISDGKVLVLLGNGDGTFHPGQGYDSGGIGLLSIALADVNGDGKLDLLVENSCEGQICANGGVAVLLGNGDGTFQAAVSYNSGGSGGYSVAVGDVNGDGKLDLVVQNEYGTGSYSSDMSVLLGNGDGTFQPAVSTATPFLNDEAESIVVDDFNGDGKLDVATSLGFLLLGNGDGTFRDPIVLGIGPGGIAVGDFNRDGRPDLALGNLAILLNISTGFGSPTTTTLRSSINPSISGKPVTFTALVSSLAGTPTGKVEYLNGTTVLATVKLTSGSAKYTTSKLPQGSNSITAVYEGDSNHSGSTSAPVNQIVQEVTATTLSSSPNPSTYGQEVTFTATVASKIGAPPDGETVTFKKDTTVLGTGTLSGGSASFTTSTLKVGTPLVTAVYGGDSNFAGSKSNVVKQIVEKAGE